MLPFLIIPLILMYFISGIVNLFVYGGSWAGAFGFKSQYFVSHTSNLLYHYTSNLLPTSPIICNEFSGLHKDNLTFEEACSMLSNSDKIRYRARMLPQMVPSELTVYSETT